MSRTNQNKVCTHALCKSEHVVTRLTVAQPSIWQIKRYLNPASIHLPKARGGRNTVFQCYRVDCAPCTLNLTLQQVLRVHST
jgi:hypothetical protein